MISTEQAVIEALDEYQTQLETGLQIDIVAITSCKTGYGGDYTKVLEAIEGAREEQQP